MHRSLVFAVLGVLISPALSSNDAVNASTGCHPFSDNACKASGFMENRCMWTDGGGEVTSTSREVKPNARTCYNTDSPGSGNVYYLAKANVYNGWNPGMSGWCCAAGQSFSAGMEGNLMVMEAKPGNGFCECTTNVASKCAGGQQYICDSNKCSADVTAKALAAYDQIKDKCNIRPYGMPEPTKAPKPPNGGSRRRKGGSRRRKESRRRGPKGGRRRKSSGRRRRKSSSRRRRRKR